MVETLPGWFVDDELVDSYHRVIKRYRTIQEYKRNLAEVIKQIDITNKELDEQESYSDLYSSIECELMYNNLYDLSNQQDFYENKIKEFEVYSQPIISKYKHYRESAQQYIKDNNLKQHPYEIMLPNWYKTHFIDDYRYSEWQF